MTIDLEAIALEAGAKYELLGGDESTRSGWCFEEVATRAGDDFLIDTYPSLAAFANAVLEAAARHLETTTKFTGIMVDNDVTAQHCAEAIRALKVKP
jgi:hypothetical protein